MTSSASIIKSLDELATRSSTAAERVVARAKVARDGDEDWTPNEDDDASYFVLKQEMLTAYCTAMSYYLLRKAKGLSVRDHPVLQRLYELRLVFEKLRLLDSKLRHQLDKVLSRADEDATALRPNPMALEVDAARPEGDAEAAAPDGIYRAPRHSSVKYGGGGGGGGSDDDEDDDDDLPQGPATAARGEPKQRNTRARRAEIAHMIRAGADQPELVGSGGGINDAIGTGKKAAKRDKRKKEQREQEKFEEDRFMRVDTNQKLKKKRKTKDFASSLDDLF